MNMKKIFTVFIAAILVTAVAVNLLGGREDAEELLYNGKTYDACLTELKEANAPLSLLKKHATVSSTMEARNPSGILLGSYETQYARTETGKLLFLNIGLDAEGRETVVMNGYQDEGTAGAYYMVSGAQKSMNLYASSEYETFVGNNSAIDLTQQGYMETVVEIKEENGTLVIVSVLQTGDGKEASRVTYCADPVTLELQTREIMTYDGEELISQSWTEYAYDLPAAEKYAAADAVLTNAGDGCHLTLVLQKGGEVMETQEFMVDRGTTAAFLSENPFKMYADETLKKKLKTIDVSGDEATVHIVFDEEK